MNAAHLDAVVQPQLQVGAGSVRTIQVTRGSGSGPTKLAAFDAALMGAGVANFNLMRLSSVIPPGSTISSPPRGRETEVRGEWGDRLYVVMAEMRVDGAGQQAWAGVGWVQSPESGKGLFVEHEGHSEDEVRHDLERSLASLAASREEAFGPSRYSVQGAKCAAGPACALVVAVLGCAPWCEPVITLPG